MKYFIILALLASVVDDCSSLMNKPISASRFLSYTLCCNKLEAKRAFHSTISSKSTMLRKNFEPMFMSNRMTLDTSNDDDMEEVVTHLDEADLRAFWERSGMSASSYDEDIALSKMMMADIDDDDDDDDDDSDGTFGNDDLMDNRSAGNALALKRSSAGNKKEMLSSSPATNSAQRVSSTSKRGLLSRKLLNKTNKKTVSEKDYLKDKLNIDSDATAIKVGDNGKAEKNDVENNLSQTLPSESVPVNDIPAGRSVGEIFLRSRCFTLNNVDVLL